MFSGPRCRLEKIENIISDFELKIQKKNITKDYIDKTYQQLKDLLAATNFPVYAIFKVMKFKKLKARFVEINKFKIKYDQNLKK